MSFPLPDGPYVAAWENYAAEAGEAGVHEVLKKRLIQFNFPIREGISQSASYQAATRRLGTADGLPEATGLILERPGKLELVLHQTPAGRIPILITRHRKDAGSFLRRALCHVIDRYGINI